MSDFVSYKNKRVVITGCFSGMGEATTRLLLSLGAEVHGLDGALEVGRHRYIPALQQSAADRLPDDPGPAGHDDFVSQRLNPSRLVTRITN